jgi:hypothetical protein
MSHSRTVIRVTILTQFAVFNFLVFSSMTFGHWNFIIFNDKLHKEISK